MDKKYVIDGFAFPNASEYERAKKEKETEAALEKCRKATGDNSEESKKLETQLNYQKAALVKTEQELGKTTDEMEKAEKAADEMGKEIKDSGEQADDAKGKFSGFTSVLSGMGTALKAAAAATAKLTAATPPSITTARSFTAPPA